MSGQRLHPAILWEPSPSSAVQCNLCAQRCVIKEGKLGTCGVRLNKGGALFSRVYGMSCACGVDPIEKKPLFHFHPGSGALSVATVGCNFSCDHCQNSSISQWPKGKDPLAPVAGDFMSPREVVRAAQQQGAQVIAYTYTEPTVYMEWALDTARLAQAEGLKNVFVTNGYLTAEAVALIAPFLHGANVDLKGVDDGMLRREVKAESGPVKRTIEDLHQRGIWVEVTTLIVMGSNDDEDQIRGIAQFIADLDPDIPWHVSRFHPAFRRLDRPATTEEAIHRAVEIGEEVGLRYIYTGNLWGDERESTCCPGCGEIVIQRRGYTLGRVLLRNGRCERCGQAVAGRGLA